ncbi:type II restriction endonuclease [Burkholderia cepacia]|uniref:site-specific DNA-methyltransferase (adenine-specific) n=1 Tax=Burkholderia cepacia TaxID=292 RepID=A0A2S8I1Q6_BURCE|nr:TaqI-like C-terminal specificity domain-containing protein [Burkholderia cepacia]PQP08737.1 type II restriction endonuclease [Burkholderia cepacia]HDR9511710.1 Eco57I restriction-modification methylase domain-containing protein [Burkholderia cepacia]
MRPEEIGVTHAVNKAFMKIAPARAQLDDFKHHLVDLVEHCNEDESEEHHKNRISSFLREISFGEKYYINTKGRNDLVIHTGADAKANVGVILEVKRPSNKAEMLSDKNFNVKSLQELLLYYLRERFVSNNLSLRHLIVTNLYEWYIFDAHVFEASFGRDRHLVAQFHDFTAQRLAGTSTDFFYKEIAKPAIDRARNGLSHVRIDLRTFMKPAKAPSTDNAADRKLLPLLKIFSAEHLLKLPFANDSNTLDRAFYTELLHLIGLVETKEGAKRVIQRKPAGERDAGSLLESTIRLLDDEDKLSNIPNVARFGHNKSERLLNVGLELVITWVNRILFLKLLEAQLIGYRGSAQPRAFLNSDRIKNHHQLATLFFEVLAKKPTERAADVVATYGDIPYLNSSLFELTEIERLSFSIRALPSDKKLPLHSSTVLKTENGSKRRGEMGALAYLFDFLAAYDFASDGRQEIRLESKALINASVLGLIFEKINGYRDGSFFTPGFVTMHMCRQAVRMAVIAKFNERKGWTCQSIEDISDKIDHSKDGRLEANQIVNSITICDPAVGSGHFLVSALNELISIKADLGILSDRKGGLLNGYDIHVESDELIITDADGEIISYSAALRESQRVQEALFHEKQVLIESCLFGVDINPNSVKICRLRLWIELLKHAYYRTDGGLETLPNIDINIKQGNSLISRFALDADLVKPLRKVKRGIGAYRDAVQRYQNAVSKDEKREMLGLINDFKNSFSTEILSNDPKIKRLRRLEDDLKTLIGQNILFEETAAEKRTRKAAVKRLEAEISTLSAAIESIRSNKIFDGAFEWRFEFPEVLSDDGEFIGFDLIIGNPPYGVSVEDVYRVHLDKTLGKVPDYEIYYWFILLAHTVLKDNGVLSFIIPNGILFNVFARKFRLSLLESWAVDEILDCTGFQVFSDAVVRNVITTLRKSVGKQVGYRNTAGAQNFDELAARPIEYLDNAVVEANNTNWALMFRLEPEIVALTQKMRSTDRLGTFYDVSQGYIPYRLSDLVKTYGEREGTAIKVERKWHARRKVNKEYKAILEGGSINRFGYQPSGEFVWYGKHVASYVDLRFFNQERLLVREITSPSIIACVVEEEFVNDPQIISIIDRPDGRGVEFLWSVLNSSLATFYHFNTSPKATKGMFPKILVGDLRDFPLPPQSDPELEKKIVSATAKLRAAHERGNTKAVAELNERLDELVFDLYELTASERATIVAWTKGVKCVAQDDAEQEAHDLADAE